jgi:hypothetical protein
VEEFIHEKKIFKGEVTINGNLNCEDGTINAINLQTLEDEALSRTKTQTVMGDVVFQEMQASNINTPALGEFPIRRKCPATETFQWS